MTKETEDFITLFIAFCSVPFGIVVLCLSMWIKETFGW